MSLTTEAHFKPLYRRYSSRNLQQVIVTKGTSRSLRMAIYEVIDHHGSSLSLLYDRIPRPAVRQVLVLTVGMKSPSFRR